MEKQETKLKSKLMEVIKDDLPYYLALRHEDVRNCGIPDITVTGRGRTSWWEVKHGTPKIEGKEVQERTMIKLAAMGFARYIIYQEDKYGGSKRTLIVHPRHLHDLQAEAVVEDFDHSFVVGYIRSRHEQRF